MDEILKALNEALATKEFTIDYLRKEIDDLTAEKNRLRCEVEKLQENNCNLRDELCGLIDELKEENESLRADLDFYMPKGSANQ